MNTTQSLQGVFARMQSVSASHEGEIVGETRHAISLQTPVGIKTLLKSQYRIMAHGQIMNIAQLRPQDRISGSRS